MEAIYAADLKSHLRTLSLAKYKTKIGVAYSNSPMTIQETETP